MQSFDKCFKICLVATVYQDAGSIIRNRHNVWIMRSDPGVRIRTVLCKKGLQQPERLVRI